EEKAAGGGLDSGHGSNAGDQRGGHARRVRRSGHDLLPRHDDGRLLVWLREDAVEGVVERIGEDEGRADHSRAEHDRERGEDGAGLAAEQSFERDGNHRPLTCCMAASTSAAVEPRTSLTIWPSARKRIRSASAAALASWVTITVVWPSSSTEWRSRARTSLLVLESRL